MFSVVKYGSLVDCLKKDNDPLSSCIDVLASKMTKFYGIDGWGISLSLNSFL